MSKMYKRIEELCYQRHVTITKMCISAGVSRSSLTELKMGRINTLKAETLDKIAKALDVTVDYLLNGESPTNEKPPKNFRFKVVFGGEEEIRTPAPVSRPTPF